MRTPTGSTFDSYAHAPRCHSAPTSKGARTPVWVCPARAAAADWGKSACCLNPINRISKRNVVARRTVIEHCRCAMVGFGGRCDTSLMRLAVVRLSACCVLRGGRTSSSCACARSSCASTSRYVSVGRWAAASAHTRCNSARAPAASKTKASRCFLWSCGAEHAFAALTAAEAPPRCGLSVAALLRRLGHSGASVGLWEYPAKGRLEVAASLHDSGGSEWWLPQCGAMLAGRKAHWTSYECIFGLA